MPRLSYRAPKYASHKPSGQAVVRINGKLVYLGLFGSKESKDRYKQAITKWADDHDRQTAAVAVVAKSEPESSTTLVELLAEYLDHAETFYVNNGKPTSMVPIIRRMLRPWREMFGAVVVRDVKPSHLKALQARMVVSKRCSTHAQMRAGHLGHTNGRSHERPQKSAGRGRIFAVPTARPSVFLF
jgi:hypothetical protein